MFLCLEAGCAAAWAAAEEADRGHLRHPAEERAEGDEDEEEAGRADGGSGEGGGSSLCGAVVLQGPSCGRRCCQQTPGTISLSYGQTVLSSLWEDPQTSNLISSMTF